MACRGLAGAAVGLLATGCTTDPIPRFGFPEGISVQSHRILGLWKGSLVAALAVGAFVIGLILWCCVAFRRRGTDELPPQVHYNLPIEAIYTVVPFVIITVLFYFTAVDETYVDKLSKNPDIRIGVVGFQWNWQFDYSDEDFSVTGRPGQNAQLVLPVGRKVQFTETSPDVIHSFWVPEFLFKRDVIPGRQNKFELTLDRTGTFAGRCAEFCGQYHSRMLFSLKVVSPADYQTFLTNAKAAAASGTSDTYTTTSTSTGGSASQSGGAP